MGWLYRIFLGGIVTFFILPTVIIFIGSFSSGPIIEFPPSSFTLRWYPDALTSEWFLKGLRNSLIAAGFCTLLSIPIGVLASYGLLRYRIKGGDVIQVYLLLPFTVPLVVQGISLLFLYSRAGLVGDLLGIGFALMEINLPFMIWSVTSSVNSMDPNLENAAMSLGAEEIQTFFYITIPALLPGILSGSLLMFILGLNEFITSLILVTLDTSTLPVLLYTQIKTTISPAAAAASTAYILVAVVTVYVLDRIIGLKNYLR
ncbi:MAG: ABC transporter permease [Candidatus Caldarchaeales archaeon]